MGAFLLRRLIGLVVTLTMAALVVFAVLELLPGDPAAVMLGVSATPETLAAARAEFGLDQPPVRRFFSWFSGLFFGDFGLSYTYRVPVAQLVGERVAVSMPLAVMAIFLSASLGVLAGVAAAARAGSRVDLGIMLASQIGLAVPNFWFGLILILVFAVGLGAMPSGGFPGWDAGFWPCIQALAMPAVALALPQAAVLARIARSATRDVLAEDFVRTARAKGLTRKAVLVRHVLRNAAVPILSVLGLQFSFLLAGTIVVENVFALPGLGRLMFQAIGGHDLIVIKALIVLFSGSVIVINTLVDIAQRWLDPRLVEG